MFFRISLPPGVIGVVLGRIDVMNVERPFAPASGIFRAEFPEAAQDGLSLPANGGQSLRYELYSQVHPEAHRDMHNGYMYDLVSPYQIFCTENTSFVIDASAAVPHAWYGLTAILTDLGPSGHRVPEGRMLVIFDGSSSDLDYMAKAHAQITAIWLTLFIPIFRPKTPDDE